MPHGTLFSFRFRSPYQILSTSISANSSRTVVVNITSPSSLTFNAGQTSIIFNRTSAASSPVQSVFFVSTANSTDRTEATAWTTSGTLTNVSVFLRAGQYSMVVNSTSGSYFLCEDILNVQLASYSLSSTVSSFAGGVFAFINSTTVSPSSYILVNGLRGDLVHIDSPSNYYQIPELVVPETESRFKWKKRVGRINKKFFTTFSDMPKAVSTVDKVFDRRKKTYYTSTNSECWIGLDFGLLLTVKVRRFKFFSKMVWRDNSLTLQGAKFQGSDDMTTWTTLATVDQTVHRRWNVIRTTVRQHFRYIRFYHNSNSQCSLGHLKLFGVRRTRRNIDLSSVVSPITYVDPFNEMLLAANVEYREDSTPTIDSVLPAYGDIFGGYPIVLTGTNLNFSTPKVVIDGVPCVVSSANATQLTCVTGAKSASSTKDSFLVEIGGRQPFVRQRFVYVLRWSDVRTWGTDLPPVDGDLIYVPAGQKLLIDQDTPKVVGIAAKNASVIIPNDTDITVSTGFISVIGG